ncbi:SusC/RagA family TonB-linked outer membrane protein [Niabella ginsenosidivorans]|uniref:SusC/RagA family TonB-linked outer membrane protein n=1 Tax=Niabella ginsenosidivorans TaxID=1176587 RepID=A0A1A9I588_9BACT|nr:SusC/RagA family TonB-linked outer membrane protein [Niabella ginsenosidivorans]ANH82723.1 SusC/RagA family TonB-linked outer membrane protein [Niabella ginsenosidivorans]
MKRKLIKTCLLCMLGCCLFSIAGTSQALVSVNGMVTNAEGEPLDGVTVKAHNTVNTKYAYSTVTDSSGAFSFSGINPEGKYRFTFTHIGYEERTITGYTLARQGNTSIMVKLTKDSTSLQDVVITGYTSYSRQNSTNAATVVTADKINNVPALTLDQILQGRVPGMSVISSSGQPGQSAAVVIRGIGSINGSSMPLYVLDGVPIEGNYLQTLNAEDIEKVTVLKDASAKALYGSRGSNGVIVITTKKGKAGKINVQYNSQYGFSNFTSPRFTMMNTAQRLQFEEEIGADYGRNLGPGWTYSPQNPDYISGTQAFRDRADHILDSLKKVNIDWRDFFFQKGKFIEQQVGLSGGNEKVRFYNSLNYYSQQGIAKRTGLDRFTLRSNVDFKDKKLSGGLNVAIGYSKSSFTEGEGSTSAGTAMSAVYYALPYEYPYAPDGTLVHPGNESSYFILDQREGSQALERLLNSSDKTDQLKTIIGANLNYDLLPVLKLFTRAGIDYRNSTDQRYINPDSYYGSRNNSNTVGGKGRLDEGTRRNFSLVSTSGITYKNTFNQVHEIEASGIYEYIYNNYNSFGFTGFGLDGRLPETPAGVTNGNPDFMPVVSGGKTKSALASFMSILRYTFNDRYTFTGSYRYDGSTRVAPKNKWHGFYSFGANWAVKNEAFLKESDLIQDLRIRTSYGITASPIGNDFEYLPTYSTATSYGGVAGIRPLNPGNPDYDWEYVNEFNAGFDIALLRSNRIRLTADFYNRKTFNMFFDQPLSATSGFSTLPLSTGKMQNRGIEFALSGDVIKNKDLVWSLFVNAAYNKNKILHLTPLADELLDGDTRIFKVGYPYGTYYAPQWAGVNPQTGEARYYNLDGTITTTYNAAEQSTTRSGSLYPKFTGGFGTSVSWKGISLSSLFSFVDDVMRWNNEDFYNENQRYATSNQSVRMLYDRWKKPGDNAILQRFDIPRNFTSKDIQDASFLRLRNIVLSYTLPKQLLAPTKFFTDVKVFVQAENLYTWTSWRGLDPENNSVYGRFQYPNARTYTFGLNMNL